MARGNGQSEENDGKCQMRRGGLFSFYPVHIYGTYVFLLRRPLDEIEPRQVNASK